MEAEVEKKKSDALIKAREEKKKKKRNHLNQNPKMEKTTTLQV